MGIRDSDLRGPNRAVGAPLLNVPSIVAWLIAALFVSHAVLGFLPRNIQYWIFEFGPLSPQLLLSGPQANGGVLRMISPLITHMFIHADWTHLLLNCVWLLAFGAPAALRLGAQRHVLNGASIVFLLFFLLSGVAGALTFVATNASISTQLIGASGGVSGLLGAVVRTILVRQSDLANVKQAFARLRDARVIGASGVILGSNLVFGVFGGVLTGESNIAWEAHMGGYLFGLLTFPAFAALARRN